MFWVFFLGKTFTQEKCCISEIQPGPTVSGELLLVVPYLSGLCITWFRQLRDGFNISACFFQTTG